MVDLQYIQNHECKELTCKIITAGSFDDILVGYVQHNTNEHSLCMARCKTHTNTHTYIYMYIYIYLHKQANQKQLAGISQVIRFKIVLQGASVGPMSSGVYFCTHDVIMMQTLHQIVQYSTWWIFIQQLGETSKFTHLHHFSITLMA